MKHVGPSLLAKSKLGQQGGATMDVVTTARTAGRRIRVSPAVRECVSEDDLWKALSTHDRLVDVAIGQCATPSAWAGCTSELVCSGGVCLVVTTIRDRSFTSISLAEDD
jgi:hypothetical protein